ncbi:MAG TPA: LLM class flavin-dependent oxidoreductase, partial [Candidatus Bathyarchaeia archaeon]|nr:LLM class flavin-dependent oxidoreductase [Candidatus Bathyarchaeia archaeon]
MKFGIAVPNSGPVATPQAIRRTAEKAEELGLHTVWVHDHISYGKDWLGHRASGLSEQISVETEPDLYESVTTLSFISGITKQLQLGTGILVLPLRNPLVLGRQLLTLQKLSEGRLIVGTGIGDYPAEFKVMNVPYDRRREISEEYLHVLREILHGGSISHHGKLITFDDAHFYPKVTPPPILIGGGVIAVPEPGQDKLSLSVLRRVARLGDGWMPDWGTPDLIAQGTKKIKELSSEYGRN